MCYSTHTGDSTLYLIYGNIHCLAVLSGDTLYSHIHCIGGYILYMCYSTHTGDSTLYLVLWPYPLFSGDPWVRRVYAVYVLYDPYR